jgi:hypothetical protein
VFFSHSSVQMLEQDQLAHWKIDRDCHHRVTFKWLFGCIATVSSVAAFLAGQLPPEQAPLRAVTSEAQTRGG